MPTPALAADGYPVPGNSSRVNGAEPTRLRLGALPVTDLQDSSQDPALPKMPHSARSLPPRDECRDPARSSADDENDDPGHVPQDELLSLDKLRELRKALQVDNKSSPSRRGAVDRGDLGSSSAGADAAASAVSEDADGYLEEDDEMLLSQWQRERRQVWVHVYDLGPITGRLNDFVLTGANLGAFHCGIEVLGDEWSFQGFHDAWDDPTLSGVVRNEPRQHSAYIYRESVCLGECPFCEDEIDNLIDDAMDAWTASSYHIVNRNCVTFAEELVNSLKTPEPFPVWIRGAVDAGKSDSLLPVVDFGWQWFKWWSRRQALQESELYQQQIESNTSADASSSTMEPAPRS
eukprot:gnl/TRDRNA2_/TRDRNA2_191244_c0_seq1.p1 gnl/TRDRNA2_/TRDRNA2_191244_c0~~gnl/TRDRNA2_/TRDRNA2_191244_c0_seq1.p1  ORF type:complete len:348 (-),score=66.97 gnl/TRDRNA2_/TRDRNA2_191244_c0_seq1:87-1130(-)